MAGAQFLKPYKNLSVTKVSTLVFAGGGTIKYCHVKNRKASEIFLKFYDVVMIGDVIVASSTPKYTFSLETKIAQHINFNADFALGCVIRACTGIADTDDTDVAANDVVVNLNYELN